MPFTEPGTFTTRPTLQGTFGMSASTHWLATAAAQSVLERGGNAFDAAAAAGFVLHVVEPHLNGPGGDLTGVFATAGNPSEPVVLMGQGRAPAAATREHFLAEGLELVPGSGALAAAVPAAVDAWLLLLRDHGSWELADVLDYAAGYARDGHPVLAQVGRTIGQVSRLFQEHWPTSAQLWMPQAGHRQKVSSLKTRPTRTSFGGSPKPGRAQARARNASKPPAASGARGSWRRRPQTLPPNRTGTPPERTTPG